ncbi:Phospholipase D precursor [compost metagenome]
MKTILFAVVLFNAITAYAKSPGMPEPTAAIASPQVRLIENAFSPEAGAEQLILKVINSAQQELRLAAYSFTSSTITKALIAARQRGVDVRVIVDEKRNLEPPSISALNKLVSAGIPVRTIAVYALHHDKYLVVDGRHLQTGSFNYTSGAAKANSENVLVVWNDATLAASYLQHWQSRWEQGVVFGGR